jgi:hypothetical protein
MNESTQELLQLALSGVRPTPPPTQRIRTFAQGSTSGWGEEIEAAVRAAVPGQPGYETIRDDLRQKLRAYKEAYPAESLIIETTGAAAPVVVAMLVGGPVGGAAAAPSMLGRLWRGAGVGAAEGAAAGAGYSEAETPVGVLRDTGSGAGIGAAISPVLSLAAKGLGVGADALVQRAREFMGDKPATAVQAELQRLAEGTGKSPDEIVADIMDGRILAENRTLQAAVRAYKSKGGEAGAFVTQQVPLRRGETRQAAREGLQEGLTPDTRGNVFQAVKATDDELRAMEQQGYREVFGDVPALDPDTGGVVQDVLQRFPDARSEIQKIYNNSSRLVPLFDFGEDGALRLTRAPTLEDAEIIRRALSEEASKAYRAGSGTLGEGYKDAEQSLRGVLDTNYPGLSDVRQQAAVRRTMRDRFADGRKAFNMPADELEVFFEQVKQDPNALSAFRAGVMDAVRNKMKRQQNITARMADPERQEGAVLRIVFPEEGADEMMRRLSIAGESEEMYNRVMFNSMTAPEQAAGAAIGSRTSLEDMARMAQGDPMAIAQGIQRALASSAPGLSDTQRMEVVQVLFSQNPDLVRRALTDDTATARLMEQAAVLANALAAGGQRAGAQTGARGVVTQEGEQ